MFLDGVDSLVLKWEHEGMECAIVESPIHGAYNGYVRVGNPYSDAPHPWADKHYDLIDVDVHGGLTYAADGWIGFDTLHSGDSWKNLRPEMKSLGEGPFHRDWTIPMLKAEVEHLADQVRERLLRLED